MYHIRLIKKENYARSTWKNGLGYTDEIAIYPEGSELKRGDFLWRLSSAKIEQSSRFSIFPHHDRFLTLIQGKGMRLYHRFDEETPEEEIEVQPLTPYEFPGDIQSRCELGSGPIQDLSAFVRKGEIEAQMEALEIPSQETYFWHARGRWSYIYNPDTPLGVETETKERFEIAPGETLAIEVTEKDLPEEALEIRTQKSAKLILVSFQ
jgi:environmental stress-induced protein Ves